VAKVAKILVVDDRQTNREFLTTLLGYDGHCLLEAVDGAEGLAFAETEHPALIITDILMPNMDGCEFIRQLRSRPALATTPVIFLTATYLECEVATLARDCGVRHVLIKPCEPETVLRTVREALGVGLTVEDSLSPSEFNSQHRQLLTNKLAQKVEELEAANEQMAKLVQALHYANEELTQTYDATLEGWVRALDMRDHETEGHTQRVTDLAVRLAQAMGITGEDLIAIRRGALLHDIGKIGIPDSILLKPSRLNEDEWKLMRMHPVFALQMLESIPFLRTALDIPYCHHEKWDGTGYPNGLKGEEIPLAARIFAIVDVWDALRSKRPYKDAWSDAEIHRHLLDQSGLHFDPDVVTCFTKLPHFV
jgi:putative two-component system response regulator